MSKNIREIKHLHVRICIEDSFERIENIKLNEEEEIIIIGEIYTNKASLIRELQHHNSSTQSIIQELKHTEGKFIIIQKSAHKISIINDKIGLKPLYIKEEKNKTIIISNTLDALIQNSQSCSLDKKRVVEFLEFGFISEGKSLIQEVETMPAGSIQTFSEDMKRHTSQYFKLTALENRPSIQDLGNAFRKAVEMRIIYEGRISSHLSGGYDTRFILGNLIGLGHKNNLDLYSSETSVQDYTIAQKVASRFQIPLFSLPYKATNKIYKTSPNSPAGSFDSWFSGLGGGELLGNSMRDSWFQKNLLEDYVKDPLLLSSISHTRSIETFLHSIVRSSVNTVQGLGWLNPSVFGMGGNLLPFFDSNFLQCLISLPRTELENYKTYKQLYSEFFPEGKTLEFTYCYERDGENKKASIFGNDALITKNYDISKKDMKKILLISQKLFTKHKHFFGSFLKEDIIFKAPLEIFLVLVTLEKLNTDT